MSTHPLAERFFKRFAGLERAFGRYTPKNSADARGKQQGGAQTEREPYTVTLWTSHLNGTDSIGVIPIRDDGMCLWGAIDIDKYDGDLANLANQIAEQELPLILCRSKSGGAHLYLFCSEPVPATTVRGKLMEWSVALGYSGVEVFPKQVRLASSNDVGNWINMPYFNAAESIRFAIAPGGKKLTAEEFMDLADAMEIDAESLRELRPKQETNYGELLEDAPPCLQCIAQRGAPEGTRNKVLFNFGVYCRKRYGEEAVTDKLDVYNQKFMDEQLPSKEVVSLAKSVTRKEYEYTCNESPLSENCNRQICLARKFGIGTSEGDPGVVFGTLVKVDSNPPIWIWDVDGARIELSTGDLKDQTRFHTKVIEVLNKWPNAMKPKAWATLVREKLEACEVIPAPPDVSLDGQVWDYLEEYCNSRQKAKSKEELRLNKPWTEEGRTFFRAEHFKQYLEQNRVRIEKHKLYMILRKRDAEHHFFNIKGRGINCWSVPAFPAQREDFAVPEIEEM